jgi:hypothetical protein
MSQNAYKVFLFEDDTWLYCDYVSLEDGVYRASVINGNWNAWIDTVNNTTKSSQHSIESQLIWACDPHLQNVVDYNAVIAAARVRYESGEPADYEVKPEPEYEDDDDGIPF